MRSYSCAEQLELLLQDYRAGVMDDAVALFRNATQNIDTV